METPSKTPGSPRDFRELSRLGNRQIGNFLRLAKMQPGTFSLVTKMHLGNFFAQTGNFLTEAPSLPPPQTGRELGDRLREGRTVD